MSGICSQAKSAHCARWQSAWCYCKLRKLRGQDLWTQQLLSRMAYVLHDVFGSRILSNRFSYRFRCGGLRHHVHWTRMLAIISFGTTSEIVCTAPSRTLFRVASGNWTCCWRGHRWHVAWHSWQPVVCLRQVHEVEGFNIKPSVNMKTTRTYNLHERELPFMYHLLLCPSNLRMYRTSKLLCIFLNTLHKKNVSCCIVRRLRAIYALCCRFQ